jgi:hypothetical protein
MKIKNDLIIIAGVTYCILAPLTGAQCPQICDETAQNTALGIGALPADGGTDNVAVGWQVLVNNTGVNNTAIGANALKNNTSGSANTACGDLALSLNTTGYDNTAIGWQTLSNNLNGNSNTAIGLDALVLNGSGSNNTAIGTQALNSNFNGGSNTATGYFALFFNTSGSFNTAAGRGALYHNTTANNNVATGYQALNSNRTGTANTATGTQALQSDTGSNNTADGYQALNENTVGIDNVATGYQALLANTSGITNTAVGAFALENSLTGAGNIAIGFNAGTGVTSGSNNIDIANTGANESSTIRIGSSNQTNAYIAGIGGVTVAGGLGVIIDSSGHLGTSTSSARYKENIHPMDKASEAILSLKPVTFRYKHELDPKAIPQFGLVAEQVEKVDPDLVARDEQGKPYSVRYEAVNAMLLNEFLKEHRRVEEQSAIMKTQDTRIASLETALAEERDEIRVLSAGLQKVSNQPVTEKTAPRMAANDR